MFANELLEPFRASSHGDAMFWDQFGDWYDYDHALLTREAYAYVERLRQLGVDAPSPEAIVMDFLDLMHKGRPLR